MPAKGSSRADGNARRAAAEAGGPWQDFDEVMERMLDLFGSGRPAGGGSDGESPPERSRRP
ncbi:hypothetical protein BX286_0748 [Streptomyces sp. 3211.6]|uniref:hypothetical protein n=1 Tax=Streptomyces TaxID=1883 RepID=UPI0009A5515A|nr:MULTISPECIES: hypothetical protein [Streptomyces]RKT02837.1 hypothetical protein BX286_0748 [Streptomyces sp. 3211.6]RPF44161.1 hypothetical protein EDD96_0681 [Streptomyces sp. Ag109_G2-6]